MRRAAEAFDLQCFGGSHVAQEWCRFHSTLAPMENARPRSEETAGPKRLSRVFLVAFQRNGRGARRVDENILAPTAVGLQRRRGYVCTGRHEMGHHFRAVYQRPDN